MKTKIRLTESKLKQFIREAINEILDSPNELNSFYKFGRKRSDNFYNHAEDDSRYQNMDKFVDDKVAKFTDKEGQKRAMKAFNQGRKDQEELIANQQKLGRPYTDDYFKGVRREIGPIKQAINKGRANLDIYRHNRKFKNT